MQKNCSNKCQPDPCKCKKTPCNCNHDCDCNHPKPVCGGPNNVFPCDYHLIEDVCELKKALSEVFVRFDTDPAFYTKDDYRVLLRSIALSLIYIYKRDKNSMHCEIVEELPECTECPEFGTVYLIPKDEEEQTEEDKYIEYLYLGDCHFELIGGNGGSCEETQIEADNDYISVRYDEDENIWYVGLSALASALLDKIPGLETSLTTLSNKVDRIDLRVKTLEKLVPCKFGHDYVTTMTVGYLKAGTQLTADMTLQDVIWKILYGEPAKDVVATNPTMTCKVDGYTKNESSDNKIHVNAGTNIISHIVTFTDGKFTGNGYNYQVDANCPKGDVHFYYVINGAQQEVENLDPEPGDDVAKARSIVPNPGTEFKVRIVLDYGASTTTPKKSDETDSSVSIPAGSLTWESDTFVVDQPPLKAYIYGLSNTTKAQLAEKITEENILQACDGTNGIVINLNNTGNTVIAELGYGSTPNTAVSNTHGYQVFIMPETYSVKAYDPSTHAELKNFTSTTDAGKASTYYAGEIKVTVNDVDCIAHYNVNSSLTNATYENVTFYKL